MKVTLLIRLFNFSKLVQIKYQEVPTIWIMVNKIYRYSNSTATIDGDSKNNTCLVVVYNGSTNRVVALTYFNDMKKATEKLSKLY